MLWSILDPEIFDMIWFIIQTPVNHLILLLNLIDSYEQFIHSFSW